MKLYKLFIAAFVISTISMITFLTAYFSGIMSLMNSMPFQDGAQLNQNPFLFFDKLFTPALIISLLCLSVFSLLNKILGIVFIARNPTVSESAKVLWILGFVFASFIATIVFFVLKNSNNLLATRENYKPQHLGNPGYYHNS